MALIIKDRVKETTTTTGTGTITLAGASTGFRSFADIGNANTTYYCISGGSQFEVGLGTYTASGTTLSRDTVLSNSLGTTALINFSAGTKDVFCTYPSDKALLGSTSSVSSTGTGSVVLSESPTITGTLSAPIINTTGDITVKAGSTTGSATLTTPTTELILSQTGDTFGTSSLRLQNRNNANGAIFETVGLGLVDFIFKVDASNQRNIRYETRGGLNQFEIGLPSGQYTLGVADTFAKITKTTASTSTTTGALQVAGGAGIAGALNTGADATVNGITIGKGIGSVNQDNVKIGNNVLTNNTTGQGILAVGSNSMAANTTGRFIAAFGASALGKNTTGIINCAFGGSSLGENTTGSSNIGFGDSALRSNISGGNSIGIGINAGRFISTGTGLATINQSIFIGNNTKSLANSETNTIVIGHGAVGIGSNTTVIGNSSTTQTKVFGAIQSTTYTVATLPSASTVGVGARAFVTDALTPVFGSAVVSGGAVPVPVYSTGSAWNVG